MAQNFHSLFVQASFADPIALDDFFAVEANQSLAISAPGILGNDRPAFGGDLDVVLITNTVDNGTLTVFAGGNFSYTPDADFTGNDSFTYRIMDQNGNTAEATVTISVYQNPEPYVFGETYSVLEGQVLNVAVAKGLLLNDADPDGSDLDVVLITNPADEGALSVFAQGNFVYTPDVNFVGQDMFSYRVTDEAGNTATRTATINVIENAAPIAFGETFVVKQGEQLNISAPGLLQNDLDPEGEDISVSLITNPADNGNLSVFSGGNLTYNADPGFVGTDSFTYQIRDASGNTATATAEIIVVGDLDPLARNEIYSVDRNGALVVNAANGVLKNDVDPEGTDLEVVLITNPADHGSLSVFSNGNFNYTPDPGFVGTDSFSYRIRDAFGNFSTATTTINVLSNPGPLAFDEEYAVLSGDVLNVAADTGVLKNDIDTDGGDLSVTLVTNSPDHGSLSLFVNGNFEYTPDPGFTGTDSFSYQIRDDDGNVATATATITVAGQPGPFAIDDVFALFEGGSLFVPAVDGLLSNDLSGSDDDLSVAPVRGASTNNGRISILADGSFEYTPNREFTGTDTFTYRVQNSQGIFESATATIFVGDPDQKTPFATPDTYGANAGETLFVSIDDGFLGNDFAGGGGDLKVDLLTAKVEHGDLTLTSDGGFNYTPDAGFSGMDSFSYQMSNEEGQTAIGTVTFFVSPSRDPIATNDSYTLLRNTDLAVDAATGVLANDLDPDGTDLDVVLITNTVDHGTLSVFGNGNFNYTPDPGFVGTDSFTYRIVDETGDTAEATVELNVIAPAAPVATDDSYAVAHNTELNIAADQGVLANDYDQQGDDIDVVLITNTVDHGTVSVFANGSFNYTPDAGFAGTDSFTYRITDEDGATAEATVTLHVADSEVPVANPDSYSVIRGASLSVAAEQGVLMNDLDPEGTDLTVILITDTVDHGSVSLFADGSFNYTPDPGFVGTDSFTYRVRDEDNKTSETTVTINVLAPTPPIATDDSYAVFADEILDVDAASGVLANDLDQTGQDLDVILITDTVDNGTISLFGNGNFIYTPNAGFVGTDSFTYRIRDEDGGFASATATINVLQRPAPMALDDLYSVRSGQTLNVSVDIGVLANDVDPGGTDLNVVLITDTVDNGSLSVFGNGNFVYTPDQGFVGTDSFTYRITNAFGETDEATVDIAVLGPLVFFPGTIGNDVFDLTLASELLDLSRGGSDTIRGTLETLDDTTIRGFDVDDTLIIQDASVVADNISIRSGSAVIGIDADGDGENEAEIKLEGEFGKSTFYLEQHGGETSLVIDAFEQFNRVDGSDEADVVRGTIRNDFIDGGAGARDVLLGRRGTDAFVFGDDTDNGRIDRDFIRDFRKDVDVLVLQGTQIASVETTGRAIKRTEITFEGDGDTLTLVGRDLDVSDLRIFYDLGTPDTFLT